MLDYTRTIGWVGAGSGVEGTVGGRAGVVCINKVVLHCVWSVCLSVMCVFNVAIALLHSVRVHESVPEHVSAT